MDPETSNTVMYIVVNKDLKMGKGKIAAQCCHSACKVVETLLSHKLKGGGIDWTLICFTEWMNKSYAKVVLKASESEMKALINKYDRNCCYTEDEGRTQIPAGSLTSIAFYPIPKDEAPSDLRRLKLL